MNYVPYVVEKMPGGGERTSDIYSRLLKDRIVMLTGEVNDQVASVIVAQFLFLEADAPGKDIYFYINSPGGVVTAGLAIADCLNFISSKVVTICLGQAASMGAFLLSIGEPGYRYALPHARIMIHQPSGGAQGQATDILIQAEEILRIKKELTQISADTTNGKTSYEEMVELMERDNFLSPSEAIDIGLIDKVLEKIPSSKKD